MLEDIFNPVIEIEINNKKYKAEYDFKSYAILETRTGKSFFKLYRLLMQDDNLTLTDSIEIIACALIKNHSEAQADEVKAYLQENMHIVSDVNNKAISAFITPIIAPEILSKMEEFKKKIQEMEKIATPKT